MLLPVPRNGFKTTLKAWYAKRLHSGFDLEQFVDDSDLFIRVVGKIMTKFNMQQPSSAISSHEVGSLGTEEAEGNKKWIRIFWEQKHCRTR